jgi:hypothetical protein
MRKKNYVPIAVGNSHILYSRYLLMVSLKNYIYNVGTIINY